MQLTHCYLQLKSLNIGCYGPYTKHDRRQFVELAFERVGMPIRWQGPKGLEERGVVAGGSQAGRAVVTISPHFLRPVEVAAQVPTPFTRCVILATLLAMSFLWPYNPAPVQAEHTAQCKTPMTDFNFSAETHGCCRAL